jgi:single-stranded-DNA-specific exonuclease
MIDIKYRLYRETLCELSPVQQILHNRGIEVEDQQRWLFAGKESYNDWRSLGESKIRQAIDTIVDTMNANENICVCVDPDADGFTSAAIFINYIYSIRPEYCQEHVSYVMHTGKQHGLADTLENILAQNPALVVVPDGGSNDFEQQKALNDKGIKVLVLDHHEAEADYSNDMTNVINVQLCDYPNKALTGAGVVWQFFRAWDEICEDVGDYAAEEDFTDLAALGMIGDMSNYKEPETRAIVTQGLFHIKNPFFAAMARKNEFSIKKMNGINYYSVAFYVVPFINACVRSGTMEEKRIVFESMLMQHVNDKVESSKRGEKGMSVYLFQEAVTVAERVKRRQTSLQDASMAILQKKIEDEHLTDHAIIACVCESDEVERNIAGLVANKIQAMYQRPTLVLIKSKDIDDSEIVYRGSARNYSMCENQDMKATCLASGEMLMMQGHANAAGAAIAASHFDAFMRKTDELYSGIDFTPSYMVDYIWNSNTIDPDKILDIGYLGIYGQEIPESKVALEKIPLSESNVTLMGLAKGHPTIKIQVGNVSIMKFKSSEEEYEQFIQPNTYITLVGKCAANEWNGNISPQIIVEDFELTQEWRF